MHSLQKANHDPRTMARSDLGHSGIRVHLAVLAHGHDGAVARAAHGAPQGGEALADLHNLALDDHFGAAGGRAQVGRVEGPADAEEGPEARAGDQRERNRGAEVEDGRCATAVWSAWWCLLDGVVVGARFGGFRGSGVQGSRKQKRTLTCSTSSALFRGLIPCVPFMLDLRE